MTRTENPQLVEAVMVLHYVGKSSYEISKVLKLRNIILNPSGVQRLIARNSAKKKSAAKRVKRLSNPGSPKVPQRKSQEESQRTESDAS